jgi:hypothetical protein
MTPSPETDAQKAERLERALKAALYLCRWIIDNRGCVCNEPGHRCGTNLMMADVAKLEEHLS